MNLLKKEILAVAIFLFLVSACSPEKEQRHEKHVSDQDVNFIVILVDDMAWSGTSSRMDTSILESRSDYYQTPSIDLLAQNGMRFSRGYASAPVCVPSRHSLQLGKTTAKLSITVRNPHTPIEYGTASSIPKLLKEIDTNYVSAHFGKWHLDCHPKEMGYGESDGETNNYPGHFGHIGELDSTYTSNDPKLIFSMTERGKGFMEKMKQQDRPFFLQMSYYANHTYLESTNESLKRFDSLQKGKVHDLPPYAAMTSDLDKGIGQLLDKLKELGLDSNTYIIFTSDNGAIPDFGWPVHLTDSTFNYPLRGCKWRLEEGGVRVPFIVAGPNIKANTQCDQPVIGYDIMPTIADLAGYSKPLPNDLDGNSFKTQLHDPTAEASSKQFLFHYMKNDEWDVMEPASALIVGNYKYIHYWNSGEGKLFDVVKDFMEKNDLSKDQPERKAKMAASLFELLKKHDKNILPYLTSKPHP